MRKYFETNDYKTQHTKTYGKAVLREKFIEVKTHIKK